ncbi:MAG TPA: DinB family protein [Bryobacteraceae bacterium]|nr:DinB family protein [Bryobacteraceae bacterium]
MFTPDQAKGLSMVFMQSLGNEVPTTRRVLAAVPDSQLDFKLGDKGRTTRDLMWHLARSEKWFGEGIVNGNFPMEEDPAAPATVAEILAFYDQHMPAIQGKLATLSGEHLATPASFFNVFNFPVVLYMDFWIKHTVHHRGQLATYLRAMNAHVPTIYGGSADEPFAMPATA